MRPLRATVNSFSFWWSWMICRTNFETVFLPFLFQSALLLQCLQLCNYCMSEWVANLESGLEYFQHINSNLSICPAASPKWPHFSTFFYIFVRHQQQYNKEQSKEVRRMSHRFVVQACEFNFSLALFKHIACGLRTFDHHWFASVLSSSLWAKDWSLHSTSGIRRPSVK